MKEPTKWDVVRLLLGLAACSWATVELGGPMTRQRYISLAAMVAALFLIWLGSLYTSTLAKLQKHRIECVSLGLITFCCAVVFLFLDLGFYHHTLKIALSVFLCAGAVFLLWYAFYPPFDLAERNH
ncbi:MAG: hypothetical protein NVS9B14_12990 [Candidatus Acidiferrum sp.]